MSLPALFSPFILFFSVFAICFLASLFAILDHAVLPNAFPRIIYEDEKIEKKTTFGLFFTVVSLLYNDIVRKFLEF